MCAVHFSILTYNWQGYKVQNKTLCILCNARCENQGLSKWKMESSLVAIVTMPTIVTIELLWIIWPPLSPCLWGYRVYPGYMVIRLQTVSVCDCLTPWLSCLPWSLNVLLTSRDGVSWLPGLHGHDKLALGIELASDVKTGFHGYGFSVVTMVLGVKLDYYLASTDYRISKVTTLQ